MRKQLLVAGHLGLLLIATLAGACGRAPALSAQTILGRWEVLESRGMTAPESFFWFTMEYVEFRADGTIASLIRWPPAGGAELRLNTTARYVLADPQQLAVTGACRHADPCTGRYAATLAGDELTIADATGRLVLRRVAGVSAELPPPAGPRPSPTPAAPR